MAAPDNSNGNWESFSTDTVEAAGLQSVNVDVEADATSKPNPTLHPLLPLTTSPVIAALSPEQPSTPVFNQPAPLTSALTLAFKVSLVPPLLPLPAQAQVWLMPSPHSLIPLVSKI